MRLIGIVDVPKSGGNPILNLPAEAETTKVAPGLWVVRYEDVTAYFKLLNGTATRWRAFAVMPSQRVVTWLENALGAEFTRLDKATILANKAQLSSVGISFNGNIMTAPHVLAGQPASINLDDEDET